LTQIDLTGPFEVLSRLPNATHRIDAKSRDGGSRGAAAQALRLTSRPRRYS
jgi:hypothetical protein